MIMNLKMHLILITLFLIIQIPLAQAFEEAEVRSMDRMLSISPDIKRQVHEDLEKTRQVSPVEFQKIATLPNQAKPVVAMAFSTDDSRMVTCTADGESRAWDLRSGKELCTFDKKLNAKEHFCVAISPDGKYGLVGGTFPGVYVFDIPGGKVVFCHEALQKGASHISVSADGKWMTAFERNNIIHHYPILGGLGHTIPACKEDGVPSSFSVAPDGRYAQVTLKNEMKIRLFYFPVGEAKGESKSSPMTWSVYASALSQNLMLQFSVTGNYMVENSFDRPLLDGDQKLFRYVTKISCSSFPQCIALTPDEKYVVSVCLPGIVEFNDVDIAGERKLLKIPVRYHQQAVIAPDGRTVGFAHIDGSVTCWQLPSMPTNVQANFNRLVSNYLKQENFDHLETLAELFDADSKPFPWATQSTKYCEFVRALQDTPVTNPYLNLDKLLKKWLQDRPKSQLAKILQGIRYCEIGWEARGSGFADTVTEEGWRVFNENIEKAKDVILPLAESEKCHAHTYVVLFDVAKAESWDRERIDPYVEKLMKQAPWYLPAHNVMAVMRLSRWGGARRSGRVRPIGCQSYRRRCRL